MFRDLNNTFLLLIFLQYCHSEISVCVDQGIFIGSHLSIRIDRAVIDRKDHFGKRRIKDFISVYPVRTAVLNRLLAPVYHIPFGRRYLFQFISSYGNLLRQCDIAVLYHTVFLQKICPERMLRCSGHPFFARIIITHIPFCIKLPVQ